MEGTERAKRKYVKRQVKTEATKTVGKQATPVSTTMGTPVRRPLRCLLGGAANIKDTGPVTGAEYTFHPGQVTYVDGRDYDGLLARRTNPKRCCGEKSPPAPQPLYGVT